MQHGRALAPGTMVARDWRIERMLGQGGFGVTYEARHRATGAHAALKEYMPSGLCTRAVDSGRITAAQGPAADIFKRGLAGFIKEAETLARLDHPSIVRVAEFFEANGTAYMALAFESGGNLSQWLAGLGRRPTQAELDRLIWPITEALIQVHSLHLLHRDIKPDNIMLRGDRTPVLIDFGAVKNIVSSETRSLGGAGTLNLVTDGYAPPEQYVPDGEGLLGPWTDVYALGATLYEAITGGRPPDANRRNVDDNYRPLSGQSLAGWRPGFLAAVDKALSLRRADRPQSIVELRRALGLLAPAKEVAPAAPTVATVATSVAPHQGHGAPRADGGADMPSPIQPVPLARGMGPIAAFVAAILIATGGGYALRHAIPGPNEQAGDETGAKAVGPRHNEAETARSKSAAAAPVPEPRPTVPKAAPRPPPSDPFVALVPGSGRSARDRLIGGAACSFCPEMVVVPAGNFTMGSSPEAIARVTKEFPLWKSLFDPEGPQRRVGIAKSFAVGKFEVTFAEWDACADARACTRRPEDEGWGRGRQPVINVSWDEITKEYLPWLSRTTGKTYRLLTEAEWEYAARATTTTRYSFGDAFSNAQANKDKGKTVLVGQYPANLWGVHDMHGNAWEWVQDCYTDTYSGAPTDGTAGAEIEACRRVVRGGSWFDPPQFLRSAYRGKFTTEDRLNNLSFRLARTIDP